MKNFWQNSKLRNKRILVCGGAGSIGSEIVRQLCIKNKIFILDFNETATFDLSEELKQKGQWVNCRVGDARDYKTVDDVFSDFEPEVVFIASAYKHVTPMEHYPIEAINTNIIGTWNILHCANRYKVKKLVFISTDKAATANCVMGATKRVGEMLTRNAGYISVRFGNVLGSRGSLLPLWQAQIDRGEDITVTDDRCERYMMTIPEACGLVIEATQEGQSGDIYILDMQNPVKIIDLATRLVEELKGKTKIKMIGLRPGEALKEKLMSEEEERSAIKKGKFYVLRK